MSAESEFVLGGSAAVFPKQSNAWARSMRGKEKPEANNHKSNPVQQPEVRRAAETPQGVEIQPGTWRADPETCRNVLANMIAYDVVYDTLTTAQTSPKLFALISYCLSLPFQLFYRSSLVRLLKVPGLSQSRKQKSSATLELICKPPILTYTREIHFGETLTIHFLFCAREGAPVSRWRVFIALFQEPTWHSGSS